MPKICYKNKNFSPAQSQIITNANRVISQYQQQGFNLTLRQLYYQFVSRDLLPPEWADAKGVLNRPESYNKLGNIIADARMAGLIDWLAIVDRSRSSYAIQHWDRPSSLLANASKSYATDKWISQPHYVEVWVEKEALEDVIDRACVPLDVRYFACKGYTSLSAMWEASQRLLKQTSAGKEVHIIHLGDHDPSGMDMSRDIFSRLSDFTGSKVHVRRIALNMAQVHRYHPPPNPAKTTDSRYGEYRKQYGDESWELDALNPSILVDLITRSVSEFIDKKLWDAAVENEQRGKRTLKALIDNFPSVVAFLRNQKENSI